MTEEIVPTEYPGLASLCWNRDSARPIDGMGAVSGELAFIWQDDLTDDERALIESLEVEFGDWRTTARYGWAAAGIRAGSLRPGGVPAGHRPAIA